MRETVLKKEKYFFIIQSALHKRIVRRATGNQQRHPVSRILHPTISIFLPYMR